MDSPEKTVFGLLTLRAALLALASIWFVVGFLPALGCLIVSARYATFDQSMQLLGTFGDSFGSVNSLIASLTFLVAINSFVNERNRAAEQAAQGEDARKHAEYLAMLASLIHARAAMAEQARLRLEKVRAGFGVSSPRRHGPPNLDYEVHKTNSIHPFVVQYHTQLKELNRLIEHAESQIGWQAARVDIPDDPAA